MSITIYLMMNQYITHLRSVVLLIRWVWYFLQELLLDFLYCSSCIRDDVDKKGRFEHVVDLLLIMTYRLLFVIFLISKSTMYFNLMMNKSEKWMRELQSLSRIAGYLTKTLEMLSFIINSKKLAGNILTNFRLRRLVVLTTLS